MDRERDQYEKLFAQDWLNRSENSGYSEIEIGSGNITININQEAKEILSFLRDEGGIEYDDPKVILCG